MFLIKIITTVSIVFFLSWVAEKIDTKFAGIISGMPLGALLVFSFLGAELGPQFISESAVYAIPGITGTLVFSILYYYASSPDWRFSPLFSALFGIAGYILIAFALSLLSFNLLGGFILALIGLTGASILLKHIVNHNIKKPIQLTIKQIIFRVILSSCVVIIITEAGYFIGPRWSGLLVGFPITFLPFLIIIHTSYSSQYAHTLIKNLPNGLGSLLSFLVFISIFSTSIGVFLSILISFTLSLLYVATFSYLVENRKVDDK